MSRFNHQKIGWRGEGTTEPLTVLLVYGERWAKSKIDLLELVTLREAGLTWRETAKRLGICKTTALRAMRESRKRRGQGAGDRDEGRQSCRLKKS